MDETLLTELGFEELQRRHETPTAYRVRCEDVADQRQSFLDGATNYGVGVGISHWSLVPYISQGFPVDSPRDYPVLATGARLDDTCVGCQQAVRRQLVRRVSLMDDSPRHKRARLRAWMYAAPFELDETPTDEAPIGDSTAPSDTDDTKKSSETR
ncbi:hypothetical protein HFX_6103 (plasmid) [Haloferax mediterranei ATCC 33500]|uniref:DUF7260 domain-containing protein n=1 Tax=Haloferax mediterranei (strain ATCC 33500 / DSM 1411 / JCM 8866 / NBRC 14739 / NCIMB 2177 / R-4) TaxID=523841 RepID=I3RAG8_HALMT|nr:hypothetical protein HFX_6103 [Haloferax mediterranei ATCC 33500]